MRLFSLLLSARIRKSTRYLSVQAGSTTVIVIGKFHWAPWSVPNPHLLVLAASSTHCFHLLVIASSVLASGRHLCFSCCYVEFCLVYTFLSFICYLQPFSLHTASCNLTASSPFLHHFSEPSAIALPSADVCPLSQCSSCPSMEITAFSSPA